MRSARLHHIYALIVLFENQYVILYMHARFGGYRPFPLETLNKIGYSTHRLLRSSLFFEVKQRTFYQTIATMMLSGAGLVAVIILLVVVIIADKGFNLIG